METERRVTMVKGEWEQMMLMNELAQGKELAQQLKAHLTAPSSAEMRQLLTERILRSYQKALSLLNCRGVAGLYVDEAETGGFSFLSESPTLRIGDQCLPDVSKKRKTSSPRWTEEVVRVVSGSALEGPPHDGYNWRKYGQKDILGCSFPRAYYRCSNRHSQGCLATKQFQRSDSDPTMFEVIYRGRHTCTQSSHSPVGSPRQKKVKVVPRDGEDNRSKLCTPARETLYQSQPMVLNLESDLRVKTEEVDDKAEDTLPGFSFAASPVESDRNEGSGIFTYALEDSSFLDSIMSARPGPDYFSVPMCQASGGLTSASNLTEAISAPASVTNSPITNAILPLGKADFDQDFSFDDLELFL